MHAVGRAVSLPSLQCMDDVQLMQKPNQFPMVFLGVPYYKHTRDPTLNVKAPTLAEFHARL